MNEDDNRNLQEAVVVWEVVYVVIILLGMFAGLVLDRAGADMIMVSVLTLYMAAGIITVPEGLEGFANEGVLTVIVLFVVAAGVGHTGALDWYMGKLLGRPKSIATSQLRLMLPIGFVSAFLNNTPVVALMIPIVQRWSQNIGFSSQQLLMPLSYASILGGTCTLIGTSTNLVILGLYQARYPHRPTIGLFDLSVYGVPIALIGITYILLCSPYLLPGAGDQNNDTNDTILLRARLTDWSPASGRSVKRSGLRDTGGVYLVSVQRAATGNIHRAVGQDFILNTGDILYFTGLVEGFEQFCDEHGMELVTNEDEDPATPKSPIKEIKQESIVEQPTSKSPMHTIDAAERLRTINRLTDAIRGFTPYPINDPNEAKQVTFIDDRPPQIVVVEDNSALSRAPVILVAVDAPDRPGLLLDISKSLLRLNLQLHHTEAAVQRQRSYSVWKCEPVKNNHVDVDEIWALLNSMLEDIEESKVVKKRGLKVIRAKVTEKSRLIGKKVNEVNFRQKYQAAIVSIIKGSSISKETLSNTELASGDILILQASDNSPLLILPEDDFYTKLFKVNSRNKFSFQNIMNIVKSNSFSTNASESSKDDKDHDVEMQVHGDAYGSFVELDNEPSKPVEEPNFNFEDLDRDNVKVWMDLQVIPADRDKVESGKSVNEFLTAMIVAENAKLINKSAKQLDLHKIPNVVLVSVERPTSKNYPLSRSCYGMDVSDLTSLELPNVAIDVDEPLKEGDILWFSGGASAVKDLRKIPGLTSFENDEVKKIDGPLFDRRLVQAVVARTGPLVGKTVVEVKFRTKYGAAVIAIHREGKRVQEHPGQVRLHAGDVLLLEAGHTFMESIANKDRAFALLSEVEDSSPPRLKLFIPSLLLMITMLAVYTAGVASLLVCALVASMLMIIIGVLSEQEARDAVNWEIFVTIASAFGIGTALTNSGVAQGIANFLVMIGTSIGSGPAGLFGAVYLATFLLSSVVTNNAAAALIFPIAMEAAEQTGFDTLLMSYNVMLAASASFMTPFGYQTNLMVYGPGKYKTNDFLKFGTPLQLVLWILTTTLLCLTTPWYISWIVSISVLVLVSCFNIYREKIRAMVPLQKKS